MSFLFEPLLRLLVLPVLPTSGSLLTESLLLLLPGKSLTIPSHIGSRHIKKVDVNASRRNSKFSCHGGCNGSIAFHGNAPDAVQATQGRWFVASSKDYVCLIGNGHGCKSTMIEIPSSLCSEVSLERTDVGLRLARVFRNRLGKGWVNG